MDVIASGEGVGSSPFTDAITAHYQRVFNSLVPACAIKVEIKPDHGVKYLHPTKGWKWIGKKRFAIRGVV